MRTKESIQRKKYLTTKKILSSEVIHKKFEDLISEYE